MFEGIRRINIDFDKPISFRICVRDFWCLDNMANSWFDGAIITKYTKIQQNYFNAWLPRDSFGWYGYWSSGMVLNDLRFWPFYKIQEQKAVNVMFKQIVDGAF